MNVTIEETQLEKWNEIAEGVSVIAALLRIKPDLDRYIDINGDPVGVTEIDAIQQVVVRDWETTRLRSDIWDSKFLSDDRKNALILLLNLTEIYIHAETLGDVSARKNMALGYVEDAIKALRENAGGQ